MEEPALTLRLSCWGLVAPIVAGVLGVMPACGSRSPPGAVLISEDEFKERYPVAYCEGYRRCCDAIGRAVDTDACESVRASGQSSQDSSATRYNPAAAANCIGALEHAQCGNFPPYQCSQVRVGILPLGTACNSDFHCAESPEGDVRCHGEPRVCTLFRYPERGEACGGVCIQESAGSTFCAVTLAGASGEFPYCRAEEGLACVDGRCATPLPIGAACELAECGPDAHCVSDTCLPWRYEGETCGASDGWCARGELGCREGACVRLAVHGDPCEEYRDCASGTCENGVCVDFLMGSEFCDRF